MSDKSFIRVNDDNSTTYTRVIKYPGMIIRVKKTVWDDDDDIGDYIQVKKKTECKKPCETDDVDVDELLTSIKKKQDIAEKKSKSPFPNLSDKFDDEELQKLADALPQLLFDKDVAEKVIGFLLDILAEKDTKDEE